MVSRHPFQFRIMIETFGFVGLYGETAINLNHQWIANSRYVGVPLFRISGQRRNIASAIPAHCIFIEYRIC